jgi:hypothetical protein
LFNLKLKKMNLENLNLVEMSSQEVVDVDGGIFGLDDLLLGVALCVIGGIIAD